MSLAAARRQREHVWTAVETDDAAVWSDLLKQLSAVEPRAAAEIQDAFAGGRAQGSTHKTASSYRVARAIQSLEPSARLFVERHLPHGGQSRRSSRLRGDTGPG